MPERRGPEPDVAQFEVGKAVGEQAGAAHRAGLDAALPQALVVVQRLEALTPGHPENRAKNRARVAERIEAFTDRRVARYWTLVGIINGWPQTQVPAPDDLIDAWT